MKQSLRYCLRGAYEAGESLHPQQVMKSLGISYKRGIPQTIADCWMFIECENVPDELPLFFKSVGYKPSTS